MADLIDRELLTTRIGRSLSVSQTDAEMADTIARCIEDAPAVDAVPVVRCKDCIYHDSLVDTITGKEWSYCRYKQVTATEADGFCFRGRREEVQNDGQ